MDSFLALPAERRRVLIEATADELGMSSSAIEKDFWVCWVLRELFSLAQAGPHLTFKGGTSLSKCWGLIERFSEDIDIVIDREPLGFGGERAPDKAPSNSQRVARLGELRRASEGYVSTNLHHELRRGFESKLSSDHRWKLELDHDDERGVALLFEYSSLYGGDGYLSPLVKIEPGARSDAEPHEMTSITPYVSRAPLGDLGDCSFQVRALSAERTFWEKALLLHEESFIDRPLKPRLSRHYYDLSCLDRRGVATRAIGDLGLFERVVDHRRAFFRRSGEAQTAMAPGTIQACSGSGRPRSLEEGLRGDARGDDLWRGPDLRRDHDACHRS